MKCKIVVWLLPLIGFLPVALADDPLTYYEEQLALITEPECHALSVIAALSPFDGAVLIDDQIGENHLVVIWNDVLAHVQAAWNDVPLELTLYYDAYGRPAFASDEISGWVDVADGYLHGGIFLSDHGAREYVGFVPEDPGTAPIPSTLMSVAEKTACVCKGTLERWDCTDADCDNRQACSYTKNGVAVNSTCIWSAVPVGSITP